MPNPSLTIRPYRPADASATLNIFDRAIRCTAARFYAPTQIDAWAPAADADLAAWSARREQAWTVVAELQGRVVGFADLADGGVLDMLFVHPDAAGCGVARALVSAVLERAREVGLNRVVTHASRAARPAFERFGFVVRAENPDNLVRGVRVPNYYMRVDL